MVSPVSLDPGKPLEEPKSMLHERFMVINGDDFGFSASVNHAITEAHDREILSKSHGDR
jgi:hypothetical protein